jgi:hypothetical protein
MPSRDAHDEERTAPPSPWVAYLLEVTTRPGWTVTRLSRESGIHRGTIYKWINGELTGTSTDSVRKIGTAADGRPDAAMQAAAGFLGDTDDPDAEAITLILAAQIPDSLKQELIADLRRESRQDAARRRNSIERALNLRTA